MFSRRAFDDLTDVLAQNAFLGLLLPPWLVSVVGEVGWRCALAAGELGVGG